MDQNIIYTKTPAGEEVVRQPTRVVQRNQRLVLVQVDGKTPVSELAAKIGNPRLVEEALEELERGGFVAPLPQAASVWEKGRKAARELESAVSRFSAFGPKSAPPEAQVRTPDGGAASAGFSAFGKPILAAPVPADETPWETRPGRRHRIWPVLAIGVLLSLFLGLHFFPYGHFKSRFEAGLQEAFQTRFRIGGLAVGLLPRPSLLLDKVVIGDAAEVVVDRIRIPVTWSLLTGGPRSVPQVDVSGIEAPLDILGALFHPGFTTRNGGFVVGRVVFRQLVLRMGSDSLPAIEGQMLFNGGGALESVFVQNEEHSLQLTAVPAAQGMALTLQGQGWRPNPGEPYVFESLQAKGLLQAGKLVVSDLDTSFMGGRLKGRWLLDWSRGMAMAGEASLVRLDLARVGQAFVPKLKMEGNVDGHLNLRAKGADLRSLWSNVEAGIDADAARGTLYGVDLGGAARGGVGHGAGGGATKFDSLHAHLAVDPQRVHGDDLRLEAGLIAARGRFVADRGGRVEGALDVSIKSSGGGVRMPIRIDGVLPNLVATALR